MCRERLGCGEHLGRGRPCLGRSPFDVAYVGGNSARSRRGLLNIDRNLPGCGSLLFDRHGNRRRDLRDPIDCFRDFPDRRDQLFGSLLNRRYLLRDLTCRLGRLLCQRLHFGRNDRKPSTSLACPCGFDRSVQRKKIGLRRDRADDVYYVSDTFGSFREPWSRRRSSAPLASRLGRLSPADSLTRELIS